VNFPKWLASAELIWVNMLLASGSAS